MTAEQLEKPDRTAIECWNRFDWPGYRALTGPGFVYQVAGTVASRRGRGGRVGWGRLKTAFPDAAAEIVQMHVDGDATVAGVIRRGTQTGPSHTAACIESPSYKKVQVWDLIAMEWQDVTVVAERHQLGFLVWWATSRPVPRPERAFLNSILDSI